MTEVNLGSKSETKAGTGRDKASRGNTEAMSLGSWRVYIDHQTHNRCD